MPPIGPGAMPLTRTPNSPHSTARLRVRLSTAALAADACAWRTQQRCSKAGRQERKLAPSRGPGLTVPTRSDNTRGPLNRSTARALTHEIASLGNRRPEQENAHGQPVASPAPVVQILPQRSNPTAAHTLR